MRRWTATALLIVVAAACSTASVRTERADTIAGPVLAPPAESSSPDVDDSPTTGEQPTTTPGGGSATTDEQPTTTRSEAPPNSPATTDPGDGAVPDETSVPGEPRAPELGVGDPLYPATGSADVDVVSYDVRLTIDPVGGRLDGEVAVTATIPPEITSFPLDSLGLDVERVTVDGVEADYETTAAELLIDLPADHGTSVQATIEYTVEPEARVSAGIPGGWVATGTESYVLNEPDNARTWLPTNDHPSDKATWRFELSTTDGSPAIANGALVQRGGGGEPWIWEQDHPMSTYLIQLIVGDYEIIEAEPVTSIDGDTIPIIHVVPSGEADRFEGAFETLTDRVAFFEEWVGAYPLDRYGLAFVNDLRGLAMETQGRSMFGAADFTGGEPGSFEELLLAHELAHQWFGNAVSPADWSDLWMNESFASYLQWMWFDDIGLQPLDEIAENVLAQRQVPTGSTGEPSSEAELFDFTRYDGGAAVVHALRLTMGDDAFFELLTRWIEEYNGTSQSTETFVAAAESVHGADLTEFFEAWLYAPSLPSTYPDS